MLLVLGAFISILIYVLVARDELTATNVDVPLITAAENPVKRRPENPGGLDIPNRDRVVFDLLANGEEGGTDAPNKEEQIALTLTTPRIEEQPEPAQKIITSPESAKKDEAAPTPVPNSSPLPTQDLIGGILAPKLTTKPQNVAPITPKTPASPAITQGNFGVQLASFAQESDAKTAVNRYSDKYKGTLGNLTADIQKADLGSKGTRYRVRYLGAKTKRDANDLCKQLKAQGQGCLAISR